MVFHGKERWMEVKHDHGHDGHGEHHHGLGPNDKPHESPWVVTVPLIALAIPSVVIGYITIEPMLYGGFFKGAIFYNLAAHPTMRELAHHFHGAVTMGLHAFTMLPFLLAAAGVGLSWFFTMRRPDLAEAIKQRFALVYSILDNKYGFDAFNEKYLAGGARWIGGKLWQIGDVKVIDGFFVNGTARMIGCLSQVVRQLQSGLIYHYAFAMIIGVFVLLTFFMKN